MTPSRIVNVIVDLDVDERFSRRKMSRTLTEYSSTSTFTSTSTRARSASQSAHPIDGKP